MIARCIGKSGIWRISIGWKDSSTEPRYKIGETGSGTPVQVS